MKCIICGFEFEPPISEEHLKSHNLTLEEYLLLDRKRVSFNGRGQYTRKKTSELSDKIKIKISKNNKGRILTGKQIFDYYQSYGVSISNLEDLGCIITPPEFTKFCNLLVSHKHESYRVNEEKGLGRHYRKPE